MSSEQYFSSYPRKQSVQLNIWKIHRNKGRDGSTDSKTFDWHWKSMESCVGTENLVIEAATLIRNL